MTHRSVSILASTAAAALISASVSAAPSAKFTATVDKVQLMTEDSVNAAITDNPAVMKTVVATLKVPSKKDLLIGVSAQIAIETDTKVNGKNGGGGSATATGDVAVAVEIVPLGAAYGEYAEPGEVTFAMRSQQLSAVLGGVIESCTDGDYDGTIVIEDDCDVTNEEIGLLLETTAAHHYNFVKANLEAGTYQIVAKFTADTTASTYDTGDKDDGTANSAHAALVVGPIVTTVQEVRATNNPDGIEVIE